MVYTTSKEDFFKVENHPISCKCGYVLLRVDSRVYLWIRGKCVPGVDIVPVGGWQSALVGGRVYLSMKELL